MNMMQPSNAIMQWATTAGLAYPGKGGARKKTGKRKTHRRKSHKSKKSRKTYHRRN